MSALFLQCHHWHTFQNTVHKQCLSLSPTRRKRPDMLREDTRVVIAMFVFLTCFIIGIPPIEVIATAAGFLTKALPAFLMISLVQIIYAVGMVFSLVTLLNHAGGRAFLERFKIGKELVRLLKHRGVSNHQGLRWLCYGGVRISSSHQKNRHSPMRAVPKAMRHRSGVPWLYCQDISAHLSDTLGMETHQRQLTSLAQP